MLLKRIITALILIPLVLVAIIKLPALYFSTIMGVLVLVGAWEWSGLIGLTKYYLKIMYVACVAAGIEFVPILTPTPTPTPTFILAVATLIWIWTFIAVVNYQKNGLGVGFQLPIVRSLIGFIVLIATWVAIVVLKTNPNFGASWLILVLFIIWAADVGGYFAGRFCGKKSLCSRVSPKKTWEGFFGGMVLSMIVAAIGGLFLSLSISHYICFILLALITALFSVVGDLGVSLLKRISNVKDSGKIFPGHGGMLDRLDSIAAATVVFVLGALLLLV